MSEIKYNLKDFKGDLIAGGLNGAAFGLIYSFYYLPVDRLDQKLFERYQSRPGRYYAVNILKMAAGFAIMRSTYNGVKKQ